MNGMIPRELDLTVNKYLSRPTNSSKSLEEFVFSPKNYDRWVSEKCEWISIEKRYKRNPKRIKYTKLANQARGIQDSDLKNNKGYNVISVVNNNLGNYVLRYQQTPAVDVTYQTRNMEYTLSSTSTTANMRTYNYNILDSTINTTLDSVTTIYHKNYLDGWECSAGKKKSSKIKYLRDGKSFFDTLDKPELGEHYQYHYIEYECKKCLKIRRIPWCPSCQSLDTSREKLYIKYSCKHSVNIEQIKKTKLCDEITRYQIFRELKEEIIKSNFGMNREYINPNTSRITKNINLVLENRKNIERIPWKNEIGSGNRIILNTDQQDAAIVSYLQSFM